MPVAAADLTAYGKPCPKNLAFLTCRQVNPQAVPTSLSTVVTTTNILTGGVYLDTLTVSNTTAGAVTLLVQDQQGTPVAFIPTQSIAANTTVTWVFPSGVWLPGGFSIQAGGAGLRFYASWLVP
jgi:hypothetical protein